MQDIFEQYYNNLNKAQKQAVDTIEGPVMVVAGPGTGKTQILTLRIANILQHTQIEPENILALTFTESGVASMRRRLAEIIGTPAYRVAIHTFHGFSNEIIKSYPEYFEHIIAANNATDMEQIDIMREVITSAKVKELRPYGDPYHYLRPALSAIRELKREGVTPEQLKKHVDQDQKAFDVIDDLYYEKGPHKGKMKGKYQDLKRQIVKNKELAVLYQGYQEKMVEHRLYDYEDMIIETLRAIEKGKNDLLLALQEQYHYFLVDEHQDTNSAQNKILELLASFHDNPNLFVVGDEKQAIFRFQGASLENFLYFKKLYKNAKLINLEENYRSTQTILDSAQGIMEHRKPLALKSKQKFTEKPIQLATYSAPDIERFGIAQSIKEKIDSGVDPDQIAVLYRENREAALIADMLGKLGVPYIVESDLDILQDPSIRKLLQILKTIDSYGEPLPLLEMLHIDFLNIDPLEVYELARTDNPYRAMENSPAFTDVSQKLRAWKLQSQTVTVPVLFETIVRDSGLLEHVLSSADYVDTMERVSLLFDQVRTLIENNNDYTLADFMRHIGTLQEQRIPISTRHKIKTNDRVHLMTAHRAKGLEFEYVYIVNAVDKHWGNRRLFSSFKLPAGVYGVKEQQNTELEDERNLFYVALTRAKKEAHISYSSTRADGREQLASQFVSEINKELVEQINTSKQEDAFKKNTAILFAPAITTSSVDLKDKKYIKELFKKRGFAVTHLNNYLQCPWRYFYLNLLRIPRAAEPHMLYGIAVHASLEDYFNEVNKKDPGKSFMLERFEYHLNEQLLSDLDKDELKTRGVDSLSGYYDQYNKTWITNTISELDVKGIELTKDIRLTGKLDKVEVLNNKDEVNVIDYKTGKPKTRKWIEGQTSASNGDYKRQLVFYNLLLNMFDDGRYQMQSGIIDFVEPDAKGKYHKEQFEINEKEVKDLEKQIKEVGDEIMTLTFWNKKCSQRDCEFCKLRELMK